MKKRNRIDGMTAAGLLFSSVFADGAKGVLDLTIIGILPSVFIGASVYLFNLLYLHLKGVSMTERALSRFLIFFVGGALPGSSTLGTAVTIVLTRRDDARYNERQAKMPTV